MSYWHKDESGQWYFDWSHLTPLLWFAAAVITALLIRRP